MNFKEIVSMSFEPLIAIIGLAIAVLQFKNEIREKKMEELANRKNDEERAIISEMAKNSCGLTDLIYELSDLINIINSKADKAGTGNEMLQAIIDYGIKTCSEYSEFRNKIINIYKKMLQNEEHFSLSYGFNRYIDAFRDICLDDSLEQLMKESYLDIINYVKSHREETGNAYLASLMNKHMQAEYKCLNQLRELELYVKEITFKYENVSIKSS